MSETPHEKLDRVQLMAVDDGSTWDLSTNDQAALCYVLEERQGMRQLLTDALDSLEYVQTALPGKSGYGVRAERIAKIRAALDMGQR